MTPLQYMLFAHLILDYPLQGEFMALKKKDNLLVLLSHCGIWALGHCVVLQYLGMYSPGKAWWLFLGHLAMDWIKCHKLSSLLCGCGGDMLCSIDGHGRHWGTDPLGLPLWIDQAFHVFQIWLCVQ